MSIRAESSQASLSDFAKGKFIKQRINNLEKPYTDGNVLDYLYYDCSMSLTEIGNKLGVDEETIRRWMEHHGIERRNKLEGKRIREIRDGPFSRNTETESSNQSKYSFQ